MIHQIAISLEHAAPGEGILQGLHMIGVEDDILPAGLIRLIPVLRLISAGQNHYELDPGIDLAERYHHLGGYGVEAPRRAGQEVD